MLGHDLQRMDGGSERLAIDRHRAEHFHRAGLPVCCPRPIHRAARTTADEVLQFMSSDFG
jgi:hypothetical protein